MYVGLDVHKRYCYYAMVDGRGTVIKKDQFRTTGEEFDEFASALLRGVRYGTAISIARATAFSGGH